MRIDNPDHALYRQKILAYGNSEAQSLADLEAENVLLREQVTGLESEIASLEDELNAHYEQCA
jgi:cell division protein FtsB